MSAGSTAPRNSSTGSKRSWRTAADRARVRQDAVSTMDLLLIAGVPGSGKNVALGALEDSGYYAVNNLPPPLLIETADYLAHAGRHRVAIALDVKTGPGLPRLPEYIAKLRSAGWTVRFLYLDAKTDSLVKR